MKMSELTAGIVKDYCGISDDDSAEQCDEHEDISLACMVLVNDMFTQRDYTISMHRQISPTVKTILGMYAVNYL